MNYDFFFKGKNYLKDSQVFAGLIFEKILGLGGGLRKESRAPSSSSAIRLSFLFPLEMSGACPLERAAVMAEAPTLPDLHLGDPEEEERGEEGALGDALPGVGEPVQLRLLLYPVAPGLPGLLPDAPPPTCPSSRMRRSLRLLRRITRDAAPDEVAAVAIPSFPPRIPVPGEEETAKSWWSLLIFCFVLVKHKNI